MSTEEVTWEPPGPGRWLHDTTHMPGPATHWFRSIWPEAMSKGFGWVGKHYGLAIDRVAHHYIHDHAFASMVMVDAESAPSREAAAVEMRATKRWRADKERWDTEQRPAQLARNRALQGDDVAGLTDEQLVDHLRRAADNVRDGIELHFRIHGPDSVPIGDLVVAAGGWGIAPAEILDLLSTPASASTMAALGRLGELVVESGADPTSLDDVRAVGEEASALLDAHLDEFGLRVMCEYDLDSPTLAEMPSATVAAIRGASSGPPGSIDRATRIAAARARVPDGQRATFDELLAEAELVHGIRDDNVGLTFLWPLGIARRGLLELGRRAVERGVLLSPEQAFDATPDEVPRLLDDAALGEEVRRRADRRARNRRLRPPLAIGKDDPAMMAVLGLLGPEAMRVGLAFMSITGLWYTDRGKAPMEGIGIGDTAVRGRARVAGDPVTALAKLEPGEILVVPFTTPAYNAILSACSGLVTKDGGPLCHAALLARELGLPAIIGVADAMTIADGAEIELDPIAGAVRIC